MDADTPATTEPPPPPPTSGFELPPEILSVLPSDPFQQLDVARKITSIALSTRVSALEAESSDLRQQLADRETLIGELYAQIDSLDSSVSQNLNKLSIVNQEKESLVKENATLVETVNKLKRDVAKLETFRKTLMMSLQDEEGSNAAGPTVAAANVQSQTSLSSQTYSGDDESASLTRSQSSDVGNSYHDEPVKDAPRPRISPSLLLASQTSTPRLTPPGSPPTLSASASPTRTPKPVSPRRHSIAVSSARGGIDGKSSVFSSASSSPYGSMSGGRTRVDGKEFFRQVRSRLSYEQFAAFLANVKELNSQKQSKEETLRKADEIFGPENKDLYAIFEGLISRNFT
ncbi:uncharacterized protein At4g15545-like isoform X2 [Bidens hawaiensis]|uniref:uncharacterized protein At4g15545-like isoform X2 n=1 Tax=Bidens hawaiensis TaxID=980011 RepID=UPI00404B7A7A